MQIVISTDNLESEIRQLQDDLAAAEALRVRPEDVHANAIRKQLSDKQAELLAAQFAEGVELGKQQRARELALLTELEKEIDRAKTETLKVQNFELTRLLLTFRAGGYFKVIVESKWRRY